MYDYYFTVIELVKNCGNVAEISERDLSWFSYKSKSQI